MPRSSTLKDSTPTSPQSAASALAAYRQKLIDRLPVFVSAGYRDAIHGVIQAQVDAPNLDCRLRWVVEAAYHNNAEPTSREVITLCLFFDSGALEDHSLRVQHNFYAKNPALARHMHEWSLQGLVDKHNAKVRAGDIQAHCVVFRGGRDDEHAATLAAVGSGVVNHTKAAARCEKRPASAVENLSPSPPATRRPNPPINLALARFGRRNTPRLNSLVESLSLKKFARPNVAAFIPGNPGSSYVGPLPLASASPFSLGMPDTRNAPAPANIPDNTFENHWTVAEKASNARLAFFAARIAEHHQQTRDKLRQAAARQPLGDDGAGIRDLAAYVAESHGLAARVRFSAAPGPGDRREGRAGAIAAGSSSSSSNRRQRKLGSRWQVE
ncbi:hypothetical protein CH63R_03093 [Colletotrichum higginsianum IMI 349063]|uniref:Uncharacterized protein n=2 Tax=Colletotrichum higginsianum TaxID=80884 RepID=A0A1B7YQQ6_COLHI|nr:hypothetical protein CH63R_03093 [Colletotrichum higginsianum IMI 349063]OBR14367.1 hypothetical protein CH63R_03093 [Colletotrichum higginsianum IMI 349063]TID02708.1 hypothetical protein CH35J_004484 [Colletotrichum higginsianum]